MKNGKAKQASKNAVKKTNGKKPAKQKAAKKTGGKSNRFTVFGHSMSRVVHRLGALNWKPAAAIKAIHGMPGGKNASPNAIRAMLYSGRNKTAKHVAQLSKVEIAKLTKLAA